MDKRSTMVSTINVSAYISLKYVQIVRKAVRDLRNNNSKAIDIHHDQDGHNLVESHASVLCLGETRTSYVDYEHNL